MRRRPALSPRPSPSRARPGQWRWAVLAVISLLILSALGYRWVRPTAPQVVLQPQPLIVQPGAGPLEVEIQVSGLDPNQPLSLHLDSATGNLGTASRTLDPSAGGTVHDTLRIDTGTRLDKKWDERATLVLTQGTRETRVPLEVSIPVARPDWTPPAEARTLPVLRIDTAGITPPDDKSTIGATFALDSADGATPLLRDRGTLHLRGHTTLDMPKKPYTIKLAHSLDLMRLLGVDCPYRDARGQAICNRSRHYVLLANWTDKTLLRNWAGLQLANAIPFGGDFLPATPGSPSPSGTAQAIPWAPHSAFVALYLNGRYDGVYQLTEKIRIDSHTVNLNEQKDHPDISGGYLLEIDDRQSKPYHFTTPRGLHINLRGPERPEGLADPAYISLAVAQAENALFGPAFTDPEQGWRRYFDEASVVNFYLVNELLGNVDTGSLYSSAYLYKDRGNPRLYLGPVWDFDVSAGNVDFYPVASPTAAWMRQSLWYARWFEDPAFEAAVRRQFNALKAHGILQRWLHDLRRQARTLAPAARQNFRRWPILRVQVWPNPQTQGHYAGEVQSLLDYLELRMAWLDARLNPREAATITLDPPPESIRAGETIHITAHLHGERAAGGKVSLLLNHWEYPYIGPSGTLDATNTAHVPFRCARPGRYKIVAVFHGDDTRALAESDPVTIDVVPAPHAPAEVSHD